MKSSLRFTVLAALCGSLFFSCSQHQMIEVGVLWQDDTHYASSAPAYLALAEGSFDLETGFDTELAEWITVKPLDNAVHPFSLPASSGCNYTAFVFRDVNENGIYDEGHDVVSGYKYNYGEPHECLAMSVTAFY